MLITKFNKMIRNRVIWAIIAIGVSVSFVGFIGPRYGCSRNRAPRNSGGEGFLFGKEVTPQEFAAARFFEMGLRDGQAPRTEKEAETLRQRTWKRIAVLRMAEQMGIASSDDELAEALRRDPAFLVNGAFNKQRYAAIVQQQLRVPVDVFEEYVRQTLTLRKLLNAMEGLVWATPSEMRRRLANLTDYLSAEYALVTPDPAQDKTQVSAADAEAFYKAHPGLFEEPAAVSARYVAFRIAGHVATNEITDADLSAYYDDHVEDYSSTDTNGLTVALPLADVRDDILASIAQRDALFKAKDAATDFAMTMTPDREGNAAAFEQAADQAGLTVRTTGLFTAAQPVPGLDVDLEFNRMAFALDTNDIEKAVSDAIVGSNAVYVVTLADRRDAHVPPFADVADRAMAVAVSNAQHAAFLKRVGALRDRLSARVRDGARFRDVAAEMRLNVSTTAPFTVYDNMVSNAFEHADVLVEKLVSLPKMEISTPVEIPQGALLAMVTDRRPGDFSTVQLLRPDLLRTVASYRSSLLFDEWCSYLLDEGAFQDHRAAGAAEEPAEPDDPQTPASDAKQHAGDLL